MAKYNRLKEDVRAKDLANKLLWNVSFI
jgi:hypothetical protein